MRLTFVFGYLLIFGCCCLVVRVHTICGKDEYPVTGSDTRKCFHCTHCHPGYGLDPKCGTTIKWHIDKIDCKVCEPGTYNDKDDSSPCLACHNCAKHEIVTTQCTNKSDTICSGTCKKGYFFAKKDSTHSCQKCSYCCFDGNDEIVSECANQGLNATKQHCSPRPDKDCSPVSSRSTPSSDQISGTTEASKSGGSLGLILGVVSAVVVIALIVIFVLFLYRRKKNMQVARGQQPRAAEEGNRRANNYSSQDYASIGPQAETADTRVKVILPDETIDPKTNPDFVGTPRRSQAGLDKSVDCGVAANQAGEKNVKLPDGKKSAKPPLKRQSSQDSQNSGDREVGFRKHSGSAISFEKLKRKLSERDDSLIEEDSDKIHASHDYASIDPQADTKVKFILPDETIDPKTNPDFVGTPHGSQAGLDKSVDCGVAANQAGDEIVKLPDGKKSDKPPLKRQSSKDSQNSGDGEVGFRKRSGSAISFEKLKRKLSERDGSLLEEDPDEVHEPIKIDKQPKSQKQKEGSQVEFKVKVQGHGRLFYQWFKDGVEVLGQNNATLVLERIELRDFGCYACQVSYQDGYVEIVESSNAVLDVIPQCRNGMRPKRLQEVDLDTREDIACLLENKRYGLGGCRQVAARYGMKEDKIGALDNSREPGKDLMEFLKGSKPDLTVYSFCKILKEDKIERFDIVKLLEDHLLIRKGAAGTYL